MTRVSTRRSAAQLEHVRRRQRDLQQRLCEVGVAPPTFGNELQFVSEENVLYAAEEIIRNSAGWAVACGFDMKRDRGGMLLVNAMAAAVTQGREAFFTVDGYGGRDGPVRELIDGGVHTNVYSALSLKMMFSMRAGANGNGREHRVADPRLRGLTTSGQRLSDLLPRTQTPYHNHRKVKGASDQQYGVGPNAMAMVDGSNLTDHWLVGQTHNGQKIGPRYDSGVVVKGPAVGQILHGFVDAYDRAQPAIPWGRTSWTVDLSSSPHPVPLGPIRHPPLSPSLAYVPGGVQVFESEPALPGSDQGTLEYRVLKEMIQCAQRKLTIVTPMLMVTPELLQLVAGAAARNVEVEIITNGPCMHHSEIRDASIDCYEALLKAGAVIREVMDREVHDKGVIVDGIAMRKGTGNFNVRSLVEDRENGAVIYDLDAVDRYLQYTDYLRSNTREVTLGPRRGNNIEVLDVIKAESRQIMSARQKLWGLVSTRLGG